MEELVIKGSTLTEHGVVAKIIHIFIIHIYKLDTSLAVRGRQQNWHFNNLKLNSFDF